LKFHITILRNLKIKHSKIGRGIDSLSFQNSHTEKYHRVTMRQ